MSTACTASTAAKSSPPNTRRDTAPRSASATRPPAAAPTTTGPTSAPSAETPSPPPNAAAPPATAQPGANAHQNKGDTDEMHNWKINDKLHDENNRPARLITMPPGNATHGVILYDDGHARLADLRQCHVVPLNGH